MDDDAVTQVLGRSYWHPNGFAKVVFAATDVYAARLHVWPQQRLRCGDPDRHAHRWDFASWVIAGRLRESRYIETEGARRPGGPYVRHAYGRDGRRSYPRPEQRVALRMTSIEERAAGTVYDCRRDVVHSIAPAAPGLIATLVLQGRADVPEAPVYKSAGAPGEQSPEPLSRADLTEIVATVHEAVQR